MNKRKYLITILSAVLFCSLLSSKAFAQIGVGVGTGKIIVDEKLNPGTMYKLPPVTVLNTGDVAAEYEVVIEYHQDQEELLPPKEWFTFKPQKFYLEPGETKVVEINLNLPLKPIPGDYFAFLEAHPNIVSESGQTTIGIAAAAKLYFTVSPANIFIGIFYRLKSIWINYTPYTNIGAGIILFVISVMLFKKFFKFEVKLKSNKTKDPERINTLS